MSRALPIEEFLRLLSDAGVSTDRDSFVRSPAQVWAGIPEDQRNAVLDRLGIQPVGGRPVTPRLRASKPGSVSPADLVVDFAPPAAPSRGAPFGRARGVLAPAAPEVKVAKSAPVPVFRPGGQGEAARTLLETLDVAWGQEAYDLGAQGAFFAHDGPEGSAEIQRYEVEPGFAGVTILRMGEKAELRYVVQEPLLTDPERALMTALNDRLRDTLIVDDEKVTDRPLHLATRLFELLRRFGLDDDRRRAYRLGYYFLRNYLGYGRLDPLMRDPGIEDVSCNGAGIPVFVVHSKHQNLETNVQFEELELNAFTIKLAQRGGKLLSIAQPMVDATLPEGSRIQATLGREVTTRGSSFTIRKFRLDPLTAVDLIRTGTHTLDSMAFLWLMVENKRSLVVMGATASGKTTTLNCLSQFIPPTQKVITIEDTREITLQHENWLAAVTRDSVTGHASERISMYDLLRAALRQRPEFIIVGEIRGTEGLTLFQAMSTGHTCFSTMHAGSVENAVYRLENPPIGVPRVMLTSMDFLLLQGQVDVGGKPERRMITLSEVNGIDPVSRNLRFNEVFRRDPAVDRLEDTQASQVLEQVRLKRGWTRTHLEEDLRARQAVLRDLVEKKRRNYVEVAAAVRAFYAEHAPEVQAAAPPKGLPKVGA